MAHEYCGSQRDLLALIFFLSLRRGEPLNFSQFIPNVPNDGQGREAWVAGFGQVKGRLKPLHYPTHHRLLAGADFMPAVSWRFLELLIDSPTDYRLHRRKAHLFPI